MKAIQVHQFGPPECLVLDEIPEPEVSAGEVIVRVEATGVNPADYKFRNGMLAAAIQKPLPFIPGMDIAGTVAAVDEGVSAFRVGDRVLAMLHLMGNGGYAEKVAVPAEWCAPMPDGLDAVTAAALPTPGTTAVEQIEDDLKLSSGQRILITGAAGAVGRIACYVAKRCGAHVTAGVRRKSVGDVRYCDAILVLDDEGPAPEQEFDCIADMVGGETARTLLKSLKPGGVVSSIATDRFQNDEGLDVQIRNFGNKPDARRLGELAEAVAAGELELGPVRTMKLGEAAQAHRLLEAGGSGKIVLLTD